MRKNIKGINQRAKDYKNHRAIMEKHLKRKLKSSEFIHHINGNKKDNGIKNLQIMTRKEHGHAHLKPNRLRIIYPHGVVKVIRLYN